MNTCTTRFLLMICLALCSCSDGYQRFPEELASSDNLVLKIIPDKKYDYWEVVEGQFLRSDHPKIWISRGNMPLNFKVKDPQQGFLTGCNPSKCYKYIAYSLNGIYGVVSNLEELKAFIGKIDNIEEALILANESSSLSITNGPKEGYKKHGDVFSLRLTRSEQCPEKKEYVLFQISKLGKITEKTLSTYYQGKDCVVY